MPSAIGSAASRHLQGVMMTKEQEMIERLRDEPDHPLSLDEIYKAAAMIEALVKKANTLESAASILADQLAAVKQDFERMKAARDRDFQQAMENGEQLAALRAALDAKVEQEPDYRGIADAIVGNLESRKQVIDLDVDEETLEEIMQEMSDTIRDGFSPSADAVDAANYRKLREVDPDAELPTVYVHKQDSWGNWKYYLLVGEELDAAMKENSDE